jgi:hypothetical protein
MTSPTRGCVAEAQLELGPWRWARHRIFFRIDQYELVSGANSRVKFKVVVQFLQLALPVDSTAEPNIRPNSFRQRLMSHSETVLANPVPAHKGMLTLTAVR